MKEFSDFAYHFQIAVKALQLYAPEHPRSVEALQSLKRATDHLLLTRERFMISTSHGRIFIGKQQLTDMTPHIQGLINLFQERRIHGLVFQRDASLRDLEAVVKLMIMKPSKVEELGGPAQVLGDFDASRIRVSHVRFEQLTDSEEVVDAAYLAELSSTAANTPQQIRKEEVPVLIAGVFKPILELVSQSLAGRGSAPASGPAIGGFLPSGGVPASGSTPPQATTEGDEVSIDVTGADLDPRKLDRIDLAPIEYRLVQAGVLGSADFENLFVDTILSFDPETQARLLVSRETIDQGPLREMLETLAPTIILNIVAALAEKKFSVDGELPDIIQYLYSQIAPPDRSLERLRARLESMDLDKDQIEELIQIVTWEQLDIETRIRRLHEGKRIFEVPSDRLLRFLRDLLVQERHDDFLSLIERYGAGLSADVADLRRNVSVAFRRIAGWGVDPGFLPAEESIIQRLLLTHFLREPDQRTQGHATDALATFIGAWMQMGKAEKVTRALSNLENAVSATAGQIPWKKNAYEALLLQLCREHIGAMVTNLIYARDQEAVAAEAYPIFTYLGAPAASELIDRLAAEDDRQKRGRLIKAVKAIGKPALIPLRHALASPTWYLVRNALNLLGDLAAIELIDEMGEAMSHSDGRVRRAAARALSKVGGHRAEEILVAHLPNTDAETQSEILFSLGGMKAESAVPTIIDLTRSRRDDSLRERAVEALGLIGSPKGIAALEEILKRKGILGTGESSEMRVAAAKALAMINTPEAKLAIRRAVDSEGSGAIREQMAKLIESGA